jgi:TolA-binding protein
MKSAWHRRYGSTALFRPLTRLKPTHSGGIGIDMKNCGLTLLIFVTCLSVYTVLLCSPARAQDIKISPEQQYDFAKHLYQNGQFHKAAEEYQRFAFFFSQDPRKREALYLAADAFYKSGEYETALRILNDLGKTMPIDAVGTKSYFLAAECFLNMAAPSQALVQLNNLITISDETRVRDRAYFRMGWIYIEQMDWAAARRSFSHISPTSDLPVANINNALAQSDTIPRKSPALAGTLSIVPGAGQLYCGRYQDALAAFLVNVGLIWAAVDAFNQEQYALGGLLSFVGTGFYTGNIYSAVSSTHKYNQKQKQLFIQGVKQRISLRLEPSLQEDDHGVRLSLNFHY